jgi:formylglycine-generating enzyme required for sulfatase activity
MGASSMVRGLAIALALLAPLLARAEDRLCEDYPGLPEGSGPTAGMIRIPGGTFTMGDDEQEPEERSAHRVTLRPFWIDRHEVTNAQFRRFVEATGYVTTAERPLDPASFPEIPPELLAAGAVVFTPPSSVRDLVDIGQWWRFVPGANWQHPQGPGSSIDSLDNHPVAAVSAEDARAYADWIGHELPSEAQWEMAARGGLDGATYGWGQDYYDPLEGWRVNSWQGMFPVQNSEEDGYRGLAPVGCFAPNGYGLFDMIGNVWEYTADLWAPGHAAEPRTDPQGPPEPEAIAYASGPDGPPLVIKGGSFLCAPNFCGRYRPSARQPQEPGLGTSHLGFRTVLNDTGEP